MCLVLSYLIKAHVGRMSQRTGVSESCFHRQGSVFYVSLDVVCCGLTSVGGCGQKKNGCTIYCLCKEKQIEDGQVLRVLYA